MKKIRTFFCFFIGILYPFLAQSLELGVTPFENQRRHQQDGLGYYIQYRLESSLRQQAGLTIKPLSYLRLWQFNIKHATAESRVKATPFYLISGSYQKVFNSFYLQIKLSDHLGTELATESMEVAYSDFEKNLDRLLRKVTRSLKVKWSPDQNLIPYSSKILPFFRVREYLYKVDVKISPGIFYDCYALLDLYPSKSFKQDLVEALIIYSRLKLQSEGARYLALAESWTRQFIKMSDQDSTLKAYLAEIFYLKEYKTEFIKQLALSAIEADPAQNALAYLLLCLIEDPRGEESEQYLKKMDEINPWIIPNSLSDKVQFQHGILTPYLTQRVYPEEGH